MSTKILFDTRASKFIPHPHADGTPIPGLSDYIEVYDLVVEAPAEHDTSTHHAVPFETADHVNKKLMRGWEIVPNPPTVKTWPTLTEFWQEFTAEEKLAIINSTDAQVKLLYSEMSTWAYTYRADDPRVTAGLDLLVSVGILTAERKDVILGA